MVGCSAACRCLSSTFLGGAAAVRRAGAEVSNAVRRRTTCDQSIHSTRMMITQIEHEVMTAESLRSQLDAWATQETLGRRYALTGLRLVNQHVHWRSGVNERPAHTLCRFSVSVSCHRRAPLLAFLLGFRFSCLGRLRRLGDRYRRRRSLCSAETQDCRPWRIGECAQNGRV
jgi:hypothetical protein